VLVFLPTSSGVRIMIRCLNCCAKAMLNSISSQVLGSCIKLRLGHDRLLIDKYQLTSVSQMEANLKHEGQDPASNCLRQQPQGS